MSETGDIQELFKQAAKIAAVVPESMHEAAFHRALDMLTDAESAPSKPTAKQRKATNSRASEMGRKSDTLEGDRVAHVLAIPRENAAEVDQETSVQGRSLALLVVAHREADVDGLTAPEIAKILTEKFRHKTTRQAVQQALDTAGNKIDRHKNGNNAAIYRVMRAGEEWLAKPADQRTVADNSARPRRPDTKGTAGSPQVKAPSVKKRSGTGKKAASDAQSSSAGRKTGPKTVLQSLINEGYFSEPRGIAEVKQHLRDNKAMSFDSGDLSPALVRLLRDGKLRRTKAAKQYVYTAV